MLDETYVTQEGDSVDLIAYRRFGQHGMEAAILDNNPGLSARGPILPAGLKIVIPIDVTPWFPPAAIRARQLCCA